jgi:mono/diheme cytochrome c family protein
MRTAAVVTSAALLTLGLTGCGTSETSSSAPTDVVRSWSEKQRFADDERAVAGGRAFAQNCLGCHTYLGSGNGSLGAPDLTRIGRTGRTEAAFAGYVADPSRYGDDVMPSFESLGRRELLLIGAFLRASKGPR